jgi:hypothetical protein
MNEDRYALRVRQALNHGTKDIPPAVARRLEAARHLALTRQKQAEPQLALAGHNKALFRFATENRHVRQVLAAIALLLGMWISFYMDSVNYVTALEEVDSALLSDELPPEAFLDNDFFEWLKDDTPED